MTCYSHKENCRFLDCARNDNYGILSYFKETKLSEHGRKKSVFREYAEAIIIAALLALCIRTFIVQAFKIPSGSMEDTLLVGDHILVNKSLYGTRIPFTDIKLLTIREPKRGDIIVFKYPEDETKDFIKRLIGMP